MQPNLQKASGELLSLLEKDFPAVRKARFAKFYDYDNNKFFDFCLNGGSVVLGYSSSVLSRDLKNTLSRGYLHYAACHLEHQAKKSIMALFSKPVKVFFFYSSKSLFGALENQSKTISWDFYENRQNKDGIVLSSRTLRGEIPSGYQHYVLSPAIANGLPVYALISERLSGIQEDRLSPFHYQAVITTLSEMRKNQPEKIYQNLLKPYKNIVNDLGGGIFEIKGFELNGKNSKKLLENCIYTEELQKSFFLCAQTEEHQLKYLMKVADKIS